VEPTDRSIRLQEPTLASRRVAREQSVVLDGRIEDVRQEHKGVVDRLDAQSDTALPALVTDRSPDCGRRENPLSLDDLSLRYLSTSAIVIAETRQSWKNGRRCFRSRHS
jgi:hypothetical protein